MGAEVTVRGVTVQYGQITVLEGVSFTVPAGASLAITGPSGSGKTSLLEAIIGTTVPTSGLVEVGTTRVTELDEGARARFRRERVGLLFQDPELLPELSVIENVALIDLFNGASRERALVSARASLEALGVGDHADKRIDELSGGESHRVALARALVRPDRDLLVADEPTSSLDERNALLVTELLISRSRQMGVTTIVATHDPRVAAAADETINLRDLAVVPAR